MRNDWLQALMNPREVRGPHCFRRGPRSIAFELFGVPKHGGRLPFFPTQPGWISGIHQIGVRSMSIGTIARILTDERETFTAASNKV